MNKITPIWNDKKRFSESTMWTIKYKRTDGSIGDTTERSDMVDHRLKYLDWANLDIISVTKNRET